ncbi:MAG: hypothetical protein J2P17_14610, partial [Mycobacterium sp.]|nr:hypothetical protein [Mycobacterium sp.]
DVKTLRAATVMGPRITSTAYFQLQYKTDPNTPSFTLFAGNFDTPIREKQKFADNTSAVLAAFRIIATNNVNTTCPLLSSLAIHHALRLDRVMQYAGDVLWADGLVKRDGTPLRLGRNQIRKAVTDAVDAAGSVTVILPDETSQQLSFIDYTESSSWDERGHQWEGTLHWTALQFSTNTLYGILLRLRPYRLLDLRNFTLNQLRSL